MVGSPDRLLAAVLRHRGRAYAAVAAVAALALLAAVVPWWRGDGGDIAVGIPDSTTTTAAAAGPTIIVAPTTSALPRTSFGGGRGPVLGGRPSGLPDGGPYGEVLSFRSDVAVPDELQFVLVLGSDARPGESITRTRADSIHLLALNPGAGAGTIVGIPRDAYVPIPGHGRGKINNALALGGPDLAARTVRDLTGLPVDYFVLTGFRGLERMVDTLGGVNVYVDRRMADRASGAYFQPGWHHFSGSEALAFSRNRNDVPEGDFSRSENQGKVILAALHKARAEVGDMGGLRQWLGVLVDHVELDVPASRLEPLAVAGRTTDPARVTNVVAPGRIGTAGRASVVYLTEAAAALFDDLRPDAVIGPAPPPTTTTTSTTTTTTPPSTVPTTSTTLPPTTTSTLLPGADPDEPDAQ